MPDETDIEYFTRRAKDSRIAAERSGSADPTHIHRALATAYDELADQAAATATLGDSQSRVEAVNGKVHMEGTKGETISFTAQAASKTAEGLERGARDAGPQEMLPSDREAGR
jgi:hypothetical protein